MEVLVLGGCRGGVERVLTMDVLKNEIVVWNNLCYSISRKLWMLQLNSKIFVTEDMTREYMRSDILGRQLLCTRIHTQQVTQRPSIFVTKCQLGFQWISWQI